MGQRQIQFDQKHAPLPSPQTSLFRAGQSVLGHVVQAEMWGLDNDPQKWGKSETVQWRWFIRRVFRILRLKIHR